MTLEHYPGMTERELSRIEAEARDRWPLSACTIIHRHGRLMPGDNIVLVVTASPHRRAAFEAAEFLMDYLKTSAPFWKKEQPLQGEGQWVDRQNSGRRGRAGAGADDGASGRVSTFIWPASDAPGASA